MELERISEFIIRIGDKRYRSRFKGKTPAGELVFRLFAGTKISRLVEGYLNFGDDTGKRFSRGVFYFPEPDMAVFYDKSGILADRRDFERLPTGEIVGFLRDAKNIEAKIAISAYDLSEKGAKIATYYPLVEKKHLYLIELDLDPKVFPFFNLQLGSVIFNAQCEVANMQVGRNDEILYGLNFVKTPSESQRLIRMFLRDYASALEDSGFDGGTPAAKPAASFKGAVRTSGARLPAGGKAGSKAGSRLPAPSATSPGKGRDKRSGNTGKGVSGVSRESGSEQEKAAGIMTVAAGEKGIEKGVSPYILLFSKRAATVAAYSFLGFALFYGAFLACQHYSRKKIMREIVNTPGFESLVPLDSSVEDSHEQTAPLQEETPFNGKKAESPPFLPSVEPADITSDNFISVVKENSLPVYSINSADYISLRSLLKLFRCGEEDGKNMQAVSIPYGGDNIILRLESSEMVVRGEKIGMAYPMKKVADEFLISVDVVEEALILAR